MSHTIRGWLLVLALASVPTAGFAASPRIQRSRQFQVPYNVPPPSTIAKLAKIQLWMTADDGANWSLYRTDEEMLGKIPVEVKRDGRYGFFVAGVLKNTKPRSSLPKNTTPQRIYLVDTQPPQLAFEAPAAANLSVVPGALVEIRWRASDANLKTHGVSLLYVIKGNRGKRVKSIAKDLQPIGGYNWLVPGPVGASYRIRGTAEDETGGRTEVNHPAEITVVDAKTFLAMRFDSIQKLVDEGKFDPALKKLQTFTKPDRNDARHAFLQGLALSGLKRHDEALLKFKEAIGIGIGRGKHLERSYLELGKIHFRRALKSPQQAGQPLKQDELKAARGYFEQSIAIRDADTAEEYCLAGVTCYKLWDIGRTDGKLLGQAEKYLTRAARKAAGKQTVSPLHAGNAHWYLAKIREFQKKYTKARVHWQKAAEHFAKSAGYESFHRGAKQRANYLRKNVK